MKAKLILINWLLSWVPLCYAEDDPLTGLCIVGWFGFSSWLLRRYRRGIMQEVIRFNKWIDKIMNYD